MAKKRTRKSVKVKEQAVLRLLKTYNNQWLIERHGHQTPREVRQTQEESQSAVA